MRSAPKTYPLEQLFQALADHTRLRLLHLMSRREVCVCYFAQLLEVPQPKISRHLAHLRKAGLVTVRREGKWMHYRLAKLGDPVADGVLKNILETLRQDKALQWEVSQLEGARCESKDLVRTRQDLIRHEDTVRMHPVREALRKRQYT